MDTADNSVNATPAERSAPTDLAQLMTAARASTVDAMERLLATAQTGEQSGQFPSGTGYLRFMCAGRQCAVPLSALREVLPAVPRTVYLPFSPGWLLGIFPLRNEMVGLVDPAAFLCRRDGSSDPTQASESHPIADSLPSYEAGGILPNRAPATALIVGNEGRSLAWAVESVGEIALVQHGELRDLSEHILSSLPFERRYVTHVYGPDESNTHILVLDAKKVLADQLDALEAGSEG